MTHALTSHVTWQSFFRAVVLSGWGGGVLFTCERLNLHSRAPNSCWPPSATPARVGRWSTEAGGGLLPRLGSPQAVWPLVPDCHPRRSGRSPYIHLAARPVITAIVEHIGRAQVHPMEKEGLTFLSPFADRVPRKHRMLPLQASTLLGLHSLGLVRSLHRWNTGDTFQPSTQ